MFDAGRQDGADMIIVQRVEHGLSFASAGDEPGIFQDPQLMADC